jgi:hypothetical protein
MPSEISLGLKFAVEMISTAFQPLGLILSAIEINPISTASTVMGCIS